MATFRTALPDNYLSRLAFLEDVLFDEIKVEDGVVPSVVKVIAGYHLFATQSGVI